MAAPSTPASLPDHSPSEKRVLARLHTGFKGEIRTWEPLSRHVTWRVGGPAAVFASAVDRHDLLLFLSACDGEGLPVLILGGGSNLLVTDEPLRTGVVVLAGDFLSADISDIGGSAGLARKAATYDREDAVSDRRARITAGAGVKLAQLAKLALDHSLAGLEFCAQVPGTLGAGLKINAGAFGQSLGDVVEEAQIIEREDNGWAARTVEPRFSYRSSSLSSEAVVLGAKLLLTAAPRQVIAEKMSAQRDARRKSQPAGSSAGSVFLNPPGAFAGSLIEEAGCKGWRRGAAVVSPRHANFILNEGGARAVDIYSLMADVRREVYRVHGVKLGLEVGLVGLPDPD